ncbi:4-carboxy-4-hydroxy-2-oxoadipate aldolase/oxaloacetate decarboxylase [Ammoniphilus sp. YIM 78166]|uniref:4-carboxy-4-hydroxy-2-oxoadipate aldolase/oxaloacetate decarboxylase n=1 Tax=Ammoniphilus sp. YIM 78166 TaxID=1644106 RepID=UPI00106FD952|nr:4-carboxy-4-hydroxy-2-oxoadipate aldolase/oxaloacetate decarboxylase [Ammoniphilus sp. YIM 78166]
MSRVKTEIERPAVESIQRAARFSAATLHEAAGKKGALPSGIKPLASQMKICGPAVTVSSPPTDNIMLHEAILAAQPGDVLVIEVSGIYEAGYWGDIMTKAAMERQIHGLIIDGCVRDGNDIMDMGFPVFSRGLCIQGTSKNGGGTINHPIQIGEVLIMPGDLIVGDGDGVVVIPRMEIEAILEKAHQREEDEKWISEELKTGKTTMEIYGWKSQLL